MFVCFDLFDVVWCVVRCVFRCVSMCWLFWEGACMFCCRGLCFICLRLFIYVRFICVCLVLFKCVSSIVVSNWRKDTHTSKHTKEYMTFRSIENSVRLSSLTILLLQKLHVLPRRSFVGSEKRGATAAPVQGVIFRPRKRLRKLCPPTVGGHTFLSRFTGRNPSPKTFSEGPPKCWNHRSCV